MRKREKQGKGFLIYPSIRMNGTEVEEAARQYAHAHDWELVEVLDSRDVGKGYTQVAARVRKAAV